MHGGGSVRHCDMACAFRWPVTQRLVSIAVDAVQLIKSQLMMLRELICLFVFHSDRNRCLDVVCKNVTQAEGTS